MTAITIEELRDQGWVTNRQGRDHVLYVGLLALAHERGLERIEVMLLQAPAEANQWTAICHATARFQDGREFSDVGDANASNLSRNIAPHAIRMAATRAKARALRDALNISMVAAEESIESPDEQSEPANSPPSATVHPVPSRPASPSPRPVARAVQGDRPKLADEDLTIALDWESKLSTAATMSELHHVTKELSAISETLGESIKTHLRQVYDRRKAQLAAPVGAGF